MNTQNIEIKSGERLSFYKLFTEKNLNIEIPIIQRDYAQGRKSTYEIREQFLEALYQYLADNLPSRDLDFVYGTLKKDSNVNYFIPLDGQQRLTTLFLVHWYLANISGKITSFREILTTNDKSKFSYAIRTSSSEFCDALVSNDIDFRNLLQADEGEQNSLSKTIKNSGWYYISWIYDPTIQSMLRMLDAIHNKFNKNPEFYERLVNPENPIITFLFLNLEEFKLTDDLYIKMNSRGKPLTPFENFKAKLEQFISELDKNKNTKIFKLIYGETEKEVTIREYFSYKIDTDWANLFWNYRDLVNRNNELEDNTFDDELMNFIKVVFTNQDASDFSTDKLDTLKYLIETDVITFHKYHELNILSEKCIIELINSFDVLTNGENKIKNHLSEGFYYSESKVFEKALTDKLDYRERIQFHAYTNFLKMNKIENDNIHQWMRVVHNLTENTIIESLEYFANAIKSINKLLPFSNNILEFLKTNSIDIDFFYSRQIQEERIKAHLIKKTEKWKNEIEKSEKNQFFAGQIGFILEFSGILDYFELNKTCDWDLKQDEIFFRNFAVYSSKSDCLFSIYDTEKNKDFLLERAILSKGDYLIPASYSRYNFCSSKKASNYMRDFSWKRLLRLASKSENHEFWKIRRGFVKSVLDDEYFESNNVTDSLRKIIKTGTTGWRQYFVENPELIRYCEQGFILFYSEYKITLFMHSKQNHRHREMFTYNLYLKIKEDISKFKPFSDIRHHEAKKSEEYSFLILDGICIDRINYNLKVYYDEPNDKFIFPFQIRFTKSKGNKDKEDYQNKIVEILESNNYFFEDDDDWQGFWVTVENENSVIEEITKLCNGLNNIINPVQ